MSNKFTADNGYVIRTSKQNGDTEEMIATGRTLEIVSKLVNYDETKMNEMDLQKAVNGTTGQSRSEQWFASLFKTDENNKLKTDSKEYCKMEIAFDKNKLGSLKKRLDTLNLTKGNTLDAAGIDSVKNLLKFLCDNENLEFFSVNRKHVLDIFNARDLENKIKELEKEKAALENEITNYNIERTKLKKTCETLQQQISEINKSLEKESLNKSEIAELQKKLGEADKTVNKLTELLDEAKAGAENAKKSIKAKSFIKKALGLPKFNWAEIAGIAFAGLVGLGVLALGIIFCPPVAAAIGGAFGAFVGSIGGGAWAVAATTGVLGASTTTFVAYNNIKKGLNIRNNKNKLVEKARSNSDSFKNDVDGELKKLKENKKEKYESAESIINGIFAEAKIKCENKAKTEPVVTGSNSIDQPLLQS